VGLRAVFFFRSMDHLVYNENGSIFASCFPSRLDKFLIGNHPS